MKKLMIAAAVAMLGIAANASAYTWGAAEPEAQNAKGEVLTSGTAFLYLGTIGQTDNGDGTYTLDFTSAQYITAVSAMDEYGLWGESVYSASRTHDSINAEGQTFSYLLVDKAADSTSIEKYNGNYFLYVGEEVSYELTDGDTGNTYFALNYEDGQIVAGDWKVAGAVPEPTSGLLLLIGVAGLALRRRRT